MTSAPNPRGRFLGGHLELDPARAGPAQRWIEQNQGGIELAAGELTIATVNNGHMIEMQKLTGHFEQANPGITVNWVTLEEGTLRQRVTTDISTKGGQFDVMTNGSGSAT